MARYEVAMSLTLTLDAASFQDAADLAAGIIAGTVSKPDTARMSEVRLVNRINGHVVVR